MGLDQLKVKILFTGKITLNIFSHSSQIILKEFYIIANFTLKICLMYTFLRKS